MTKEDWDAIRREGLVAYAPALPHRLTPHESPCPEVGSTAQRNCWNICRSCERAWRSDRPMLLQAAEDTRS
jgi:hypothetical protein